MASLYTDSVRLARYETFRKRTKCCNIVFGISLWVMMIAALTEIFEQIVSGIFDGILYGRLMPFFVMLAVSAEMVFSVCAVYRRDRRLLLGALICASVFTVGGLFESLGDVSVPPLLASAAASLVWHKLEQEEGFPLFEITYAEQSKRQKAQDQYVQNRIVIPEHDDIMDEL